MSELESIYIPLTQAFLCADCDSVGNNASKCAHCGSEHGIVSLANVLGRDTKAASEETAIADC